MRDWAASFRPASFRGARFRVDSDGPETGRRVAVHEISGGEVNPTEDMGRLSTVVSVLAYVASDAADREGLALEAACALPGPALLTLPMDLPKLVHCQGCARDRRKDKMGYIAYRMDFVEAGAAASLAGSPLGALRTVFSGGLAGAATALAGLF